MNSELQAQLLSRLSQSEDPWVERKATFDERDVRKTLVAFANSVREGETAVLFLGASNKGDHPGLNDADGTQKKVRGIAHEHCYPAIEHQTCVLPLSANGKNKEVLAVLVPHSRNRPHFAGVAYVRQGSETRVASTEVFKELVASQNDKARRLLQHKGEKIVLRFRTTTGFWYDVEGRVEACDAVTVTIHDIESYIWSFPISEIELSQGFSSPLITARPNWTEEQQIRRMIARWANQYHGSSADSVRLYRDNALIAQLLADPAKVLPAAAAEADGTTKMALKSLVVHLKWELKKIQNPMSRVQKLKSLESLFQQRLRRAIVISNLDVVAAATESIAELATSLEEVEEFLEILSLRFPKNKTVSKDTVRNALFWKLGFT